MTTTAINGAAASTTSTSENYGFAALDQGDFLKLLTVQMQQQDPFDPVDNKEMLAQMAQFSSLSGITEMGTTLKAIADKLDAVLAAQAAAASSTSQS